ncbi:putative F-box domain-containing protein [Tanacetum coccineum]
MADYYIPFEIQEEIIKSLPVKSLLRFRSVSKHWKSFINSSKFIHDHHVIHHSESQHHFLISYLDTSNDLKYVSIVDDYTFPLQKLSVTIPMDVKLLHQPHVVGSSQGLVCIHGHANNKTKTRPVIWNSTVNKSVAIDVLVSKVFYNMEALNTIEGFGVSPETLDPMLVKITNHFWDNLRQVESIWDKIVNVWTLLIDESVCLQTLSILYILHEMTLDSYT